MHAMDRYFLGPFEIWPDQHRITGPDGEQRLEPKAMAVLQELVAAEGRTVPREVLIGAVWPRGFVTDDALNGCVAQLRRAFGDHAHAPRYIATVPKVGYRLVQPCTHARKLPDASPAAPGPPAPSTGTLSLPAAGRTSRLHIPRTPALLATLATVPLMLAAGTWFAWRNRPPPENPGTVTVHARQGVAVLPFANLSAEKSNAFFARGMQEEILSDLAGIADLKVISRTSVMKYQNVSRRSMREIARNLGVTYVIEGSVQRVGHRIRVTAQLIDARHDAHLWADHYDRDVTDVFAIQSEIAQNIADHLRTRLSPHEKAAIRRAPTTDLKAYELYDEARNILIYNDPDGAHRSLDRQVAVLEQAIARDPGFALAYCALARAQDELSGFSESSRHLKAARNAVDAALRLQPNLDDAHRELGRYFYFAGELDRAYDELLAVSRIWPNDAEAFRLLGEMDRARGHWQMAVTHLRRAVELDPRNGEYTHHLQLTYRMMHRYDEGLRFIREAFARDQQYPAWKWLYLAEYRLDQGRLDAAREALSHLPMGFSPTGEIWIARFHTALFLRDYSRARRIVEAAPKRMARTMFTGQPPESWANGVLARLRGDRQEAKRIFTSVRAQLKARQPSDVLGSRYWELSEASQVDAELGLKATAIVEARKAFELSRTRAMSHQRMALNLALVHTIVGEHDRAIEQLEASAAMPAGPSFGDLRFNPLWDPLRGDPRFEKLVATLAPAAHLEATDGKP